MVVLKTPRDGAWNMVDRKCYRPVTIDRWAVVVYERKERFGKDAAHDMIKNFLQQFAALGMYTDILLTTTCPSHGCCW